MITLPKNRKVANIIHSKFKSSNGLEIIWQETHHTKNSILKYKSHKTRLEIHAGIQILKLSVFILFLVTCPFYAVFKQGFFL